MQVARSGYLIAPRVAVFAPVILLTAVFAFLASQILADDELHLRLSMQAMIGCGLLYAVTAALLVLFGLRNISRLESLGLTDTLTGLPNRRALHQDAEPGQERATALVDLDGFEAVNDHYGHFVGDRVIKQCATILESICGKEGRVYRLGGDEFAITVGGPLAGNRLELICRTIVDRLARPVMVDDRAVMLGASIGLAHSIGDDGLTSSELLRRADVATYAAKLGGKMQCTWFKEEFDYRRQQASQFETELRNALLNEEFRVLYRPSIEPGSGALAAVEAMLCWHRPDGKQVGADSFRAMAEENGLINPIGLWALRKACTDALAWQTAKLSVNVSAVQMINSEFPIRIRQLLAELGFPGARLELQVTRGSHAGDNGAIERGVDAIRALGISIIFTDPGFGDGESGALLRKFQLEKPDTGSMQIANTSGNAFPGLTPLEGIGVLTSHQVTELLSSTNSGAASANVPQSQIAG